MNLYLYICTCIINKLVYASIYIHGYVGERIKKLFKREDKKNYILGRN